MSVSTRNLIITLVVSIILILVTMLSLNAVSPTVWDGMQPASCLPDGCFCETILNADAIRQPVNSLSSLAFAVVGVWILVTAGQSGAAQPFSATHRVVMGIAAVVIGVGSAFYHASMTFVGQFFDIFGMYLMTALMLVYAFQRLFQWPLSTAALAYIGLNAALTVIQLAVPETRRYVFAVVLILALIAEAVIWFQFKPARDYRLFWIGLAAFAAAFVVWTLDNSGLVCTPGSLLQGHALWHVLGAVAVGFLWGWYVSEAG